MFSADLDPTQLYPIPPALLRNVSKWRYIQMSWFAKSTEMYTLKRPCRCYVFCVVTLGLSTSEISAEAFHVYSCLCPSGKFTLDNSVLNTASTTVTTYMAQNIQGFDTCARLRLLGLVTCCFATS